VNAVSKAVTRRIEEGFDFRHPDYEAVARVRKARLEYLRAHPEQFQLLKLYYRKHIADFISDWGITYDPRNVSKGRPAFMPFILQPKQRELIEWILERWRANEPGIVEKSRDTGASWVTMALAISLCVLYEGISIGFGSATEIKLDRSGDPDSLFWKGRLFIEHLPAEFRGGCDIRYDAPDKRILFPDTAGSITGEVGDKIGHGGRKTIYFLDESAHVEHPQLIDSGLVGVTDCRIDVSSVSINGMANAFAQRRHSGKIQVFTYHYRDDLRKDGAWRTKKEGDTDPIVWAANYEINYSAAAEGVIIPYLWVQAAVGARQKLKLTMTGVRRGALDVADEGPDLNCLAARHGNEVIHCESWSGKNSDQFFTAERAYLICDNLKLEGFEYDADGLGGNIKAAAVRIAERRAKQHLRRLDCRPFKGSAGVFDPERNAPGTDIKNKERFQNLKSQSWFLLRDLLWHTFRAVNGEDHDSDKVLSLSPDIPELQKLMIEISQPQWRQSTTGKIVVEKKPDGVKSPDRGDAVMMLFAPKRRPMKIDERLLEDPDDVID
jgi:phage terminase large subunit